MQQLFQQVDDKRDHKHWIYGFLAIASPIITGFGFRLYQSAHHADFWSSLDAADDANRMAGAMMAIAEAGEWMFRVGIACIVGFVFAVISIKLKQAVTIFNFLALTVNGLPLLLFVFGLIRAFRW